MSPEHVSMTYAGWVLYGATQMALGLILVGILALLCEAIPTDIPKRSSDIQ